MGRRAQFSRSFHLLLVSVALFLPLPHLRAQDESTAKKSAEISPFAGFLMWKPDLYTGTDYGGTVGVDFTKFIRHSPIVPSFEARVTRADGPIINESSYLIGLKLQGEAKHRFHPYADVLWGRGTIHYNQHTFYPGDNTGLIDFGAGLDFDINKHWAAKVDYQWQHWQPGSNQIFYPSGLLFGVTYHIPFRPYVSHRDPH